MTSEEWRNIAGYEGRYEVSSMGRVRSIDRTTMLANGNARHVRERILKPTVAPNGYPMVALHCDGQTSRTIHSLVAKAFLGEPIAGQEVCHADGNRLNPVLSNLRWDTRSANNLDAVAHGTNSYASRTKCPQGHDYTPENTYLYDGRRSCRTCHTDAVRRHDAKRRAA